MATRRVGTALPGMLLAGVLLIAGCTTSGVPMAPSPGDPAPATPSAGPTPSGWPSGKPPLQTMPPLPSGSPATVPDRHWQAILADLAARGVSATPTVLSAEAVTWPDSSLGCPSPGVMYTQALVDGMRVVVEAGGERYDYRLGGAGQLKLCQR